MKAAFMTGFREEGPKGQGGWSTKPHSKLHGLVEGVIEIAKDLPSHLQVSLFNPGARYRCLARYSASGLHADNPADVQGLALKVVGVEGTPRGAANIVFASPGVKLPLESMYGIAFAANLVSAKHDCWRAFKALSYPPNWRFLWQLAANAKWNERVHRDQCLPSLHMTSMPSAFGEKKSARFTLMAKQTQKFSSLELKDLHQDDKYRDSMKIWFLKGQPIKYDLCIQVQSRGQYFDDEDINLIWDPKIVPLQKVGTFTIPPQQFDTSDRFDWGQKLFFGPGEIPEELKPLGPIGRSRAELYEALGLKRLERLGIKDRPNADDFPFSYVQEQV